MIPGRASAALIPNQPNRDASALSLFLIHSFKPLSSLEGGKPPPDAAAPPPPVNNASTSTPMAIPIAVSIEAIVIPCSLNRVRIFSANEVSLSNTLAIVSQMLVIWDFSLPFSLLVGRLLSQGYEVKHLRNSFQKFYGRYPDLIGKYQRSVKDMVADSFPD